MTDSRQVVLKALSLLNSGRNLPDALSQAGISKLSPRDRAFARRLAVHAVRHRRRLEQQIQAYLQRPTKDRGVLDLLWLGAAQIDLADVATHAAVNSTVEVAPKRLRGLVNAILRRRLREAPAAPQGLAEQHSFPGWMVARITCDWGDRAGEILDQLNQDPALCLRINRQKSSRAQWLTALSDDSAQSLGSDVVQSDGVVLTQSRELAELPGYADGGLSVQGPSAQAAAHLMQLQSGQRVLDACAAPGGKTAHMLELCPDIVCTALDIEPVRVARIEDNLKRLGLQARCMSGDMLEPGDWAGEYDRILLDVPCSGTGVIARHPDIKWLRREQDVAQLAARQLKMLQRAWSWLVPGGVLLYCTCSILSEENDAVVAEFLKGQSGARAQALSLPFGQASEYGWRVAPQAPYEGFYFARLIKDP